jgi:hypothetical protein
MEQSTQIPASLPPLVAPLALVQSLVFDLRRNMDDLRFRLEALDSKASQLLQFLSTLHDAHHLPPEAGQAAIAQPVATFAQVLALEEKKEHVSSQTDDTMQLNRTPVDEELPAPGDTTFAAFCMALSRHYNPYR